MAKSVDELIGKSAKTLNISKNIQPNSQVGKAAPVVDNSFVSKVEKNKKPHL